MFYSDMYSIIYNITLCFDVKKMAKENHIWLKKCLTFSQIDYAITNVGACASLATATVKIK